MKLAMIFWATLVAACTLAHAKAGAATDSFADEVKNLLRSTLQSGHFKAGRVEEILLSEPETEAENLVYITEFSVRTGTRVVHCEDWKFAIRRKGSAWGLVKLERGRCND